MQQISYRGFSELYLEISKRLVLDSSESNIHKDSKD